MLQGWEVPSLKNSTDSPQSGFSKSDPYKNISVEQASSAGVPKFNTKNCYPNNANISLTQDLRDCFHNNMFAKDL